MGEVKPFKSLPFRNAKKWGFMDCVAGVRTDAKYSWASRFSYDIAAAHIDRGLVLVNASFEEIAFLPNAKCEGIFQCGMMPISIGEKFGFINRKGEIAISPQFDDCYPFSGEFAVVEKDSKQGIIDRNGEWVCVPKFARICPFDSNANITCARLLDADTGYVLIDMHGIQQNTLCFTYAGKSIGGFVPVRFNQVEWGVISVDGSICFKTRLDSLESCVSELRNISACQNGSWGVLDLAGEWIVEPVHTSLGNLVEDRRLVYVGGDRNQNGHLQNGAFGYLNELHEMAIMPVYENAYDFENGVAVVEYGTWPNTCFGYIDQNGNDLWLEER